MKTINRILMIASFFYCYSCFGALSYFLRIDGIDGESTDVRHSNQIVVSEFGFGVTQVASAGEGGGHFLGKPQFADLIIKKKVDKSSPKLLLSSAIGDHLKTIILTVTLLGPSPLDFYSIRLTDCLVSSVKTRGDGGSLTETVSFSYAKIEWEYKQVKADGSLGAPIRAGYDIPRGAKTLAAGKASLRSSGPEDGAGAVENDPPSAGATQGQGSLSVSCVRTDASHVSLSFNAEAGRIYRIVGSETSNGTYRYLETVQASDTKKVVVTLPTPSTMQFFRVEETP